MTGKIGKSNMAVKCTAGTHDIAVGQDNYYEKLNDKWIRCTDLECFKKQGGTYDSNFKPGPKAKTPEELFKYRQALSEFAYAYAKAKAKEEIPDPMPVTTTASVSMYESALKEVIRDRRILTSVFYYGIMKAS